MDLAEVETIVIIVVLAEVDIQLLVSAEEEPEAEAVNTLVLLEDFLLVVEKNL